MKKNFKMEKKYYFFHVCEMWPEAKKKDGGEGRERENRTIPRKIP